MGGGNPPAPPAQPQGAAGRAADERPPVAVGRNPGNQQQRQKGQAHRTFQMTNSQLRKNNSTGFLQRLKQKKDGGKGGKK